MQSPAQMVQCLCDAQIINALISNDTGTFPQTGEYYFSGPLMFQRRIGHMIPFIANDLLKRCVIGELICVYDLIQIQMNN